MSRGVFEACTLQGVVHDHGQRATEGALEMRKYGNPASPATVHVHEPRHKEGPFSPCLLHVDQWLEFVIVVMYVCYCYCLVFYIKKQYRADTAQSENNIRFSAIHHASV